MSTLLHHLTATSSPVMINTIGKHAVAPISPPATPSPPTSPNSSFSSHSSPSSSKPGCRSSSISSSRSLVRVSSSGNGNGHVVTSERADIKSSVPAAELLQKYTPEQVFSCPEESLFYSQCLQKVLHAASQASSVSPNGTEPLLVEFGTGDGSPVLDALINAGQKFNGRIYGYELNRRAADVAAARARQLGLADKYEVRASCFFTGTRAMMPDVHNAPATSWLVANPPYIPSPDANILMPELHGGTHGCELTNDLLSLGFPNAMLLVSSYSNPLHTIQHARELGYSVTDFVVTPLPFGHYSSEPKVKNWIRYLKTHGKAFFMESPSSNSARTTAAAASGSTDNNGWYLLAGVMFQKRDAVSGGSSNDTVPDASAALLRVLQSLS